MACARAGRDQPDGAPVSDWRSARCPGAGCTQDRVLLSVRCVGEVLLQVAPRLLEVRAAAQDLLSAAQPAGI